MKIEDIKKHRVVDIVLDNESQLMQVMSILTTNGIPHEPMISPSTSRNMIRVIDGKSFIVHNKIFVGSLGLTSSTDTFDYASFISSNT